MKRIRGRRVGVMVGAAAVLAAAVVVANAAAVTVLVGNLRIAVEGGTSPRTLPRNALAPILFHGSASVSTTDGSHVPPASSTEILVDRHIAIDTTGLPTCSVREIEGSPPAAAMKACGDALIGKGTATAEVQFPEQAAFTAKGPLLAFNGPAEGGYGGASYHEQIYYVYADVPVPTALIAVATVAKGSGPYGYDISVSIPKIAGGAGSFSGAEFTIDRKWAYRGKKHSFLSAECVNAHFDAQVEVNFGDGSHAVGRIVQACRSRG